MKVIQLTKLLFLHFSFLAVIFLPTSTSATATKAYIIDIHQENATYIFLRNAPGLNSGIYDPIGNGKCVLGTNTVKYSDGIEWISLMYPKGWVAKEYLKESQECEDLFEILNRFYSLRKEKCVQEYSADDRYALSKNDGIDVEAATKYFDLITSDSTYRFTSHWADGDSRDVVYKDKDNLFDALQYIIIRGHCNSTCYETEPSCTQKTCLKFPDEYPVCENQYQSFLHNYDLGYGTIRASDEFDIPGYYIRVGYYHDMTLLMRKMNRYEITENRYENRWKVIFIRDIYAD